MYKTVHNFYTEIKNPQTCKMLSKSLAESCLYKKLAPPSPFDLYFTKIVHCGAFCLENLAEIKVIKILLERFGNHCQFEMKVTSLA